MAINTRTTRKGRSSSSSSSLSLSAAITEAATWLCAIFLIGLILVGSIYSEEEEKATVTGGGIGDRLVFDRQRACDEIYVVGEGETLNTISEKCGDPYIVERNPHIHDPDDVFPGLVIKITPSVPTRKLLNNRR